MNTMEKNNAFNRLDFQNPQVLSFTPSALNCSTRLKKCRRSEVVSKCEQLRTACGKMCVKDYPQVTPIELSVYRI
jgi:hypothetical protein